MRHFSLFFLTFLLVVPSVNADIYKWVDENGVTQYSDAPLQGKRAQKVEIAPSPPNEEMEKARRERQQLLERDRNRKNISTELLAAIEKADAERVLALLQQGVDSNARDPLGRTALMYAGINGQTKIIMTALLNSGASVNARSSDGTTALIASVIFSDPDAIRLLLSRGAEVNARDSKGQSALQWASLRLRSAPPDRKRFNFPERNQYGDLTMATTKEVNEVIQILKGAGGKE